MEQFGINSTDTQNKSSKSFKLNVKYFAQKQKTVEEIDVDSLRQPMRSSTPTPSTDGSTILAGNLDVTLDDLATGIEETDDLLGEDLLGEASCLADIENDNLFKPYIAKIKRR